MLPVRGCHPLRPIFPDRSGHTHGSAGPRSLAATRGVSVDVLSSGYLDVSVPRVCFLNPIYSGQEYLVRLPGVLQTQNHPDTTTPHRRSDAPIPRSSRPRAGSTTNNLQVGCPIRKFVGQSLFSAHHDLSQSITSFIASYCQGIHQTPFSRLIRSRGSANPLRHGSILSRSAGWFARRASVPHGDGLWLVYLTWRFRTAQAKACRPMPHWQDRLRNRCVSL